MDRTFSAVEQSRLVGQIEQHLSPEGLLPTFLSDGSSGDFQAANKKFPALKPSGHSSDKLISERVNLVKELFVRHVKIIDRVGKSDVASVQADFAFPRVVRNMLDRGPQHTI